MNLNRFHEAISLYKLYRFVFDMCALTHPIEGNTISLGPDKERYLNDIQGTTDCHRQAQCLPVMLRGIPETIEIRIK